jgi:hypothetical protein
MSEALIALAVGFFILLVVVPILTIILLTFLDILSRIDIGFSKLVWLATVLFLPVFGLLAYWLLRPKSFNPWEEKEPLGTFVIVPGQYAEGRVPVGAAAAPTPVPAGSGAARLAVVPESGADPQPEDGHTELPRRVA